MNFLVYKNRKTQCIRKLGLTCRLCTIQSLRTLYFVVWYLFVHLLHSTNFTYQLLLLLILPYCTNSYLYFKYRTVHTLNTVQCTVLHCTKFFSFWDSLFKPSRKPLVKQFKLQILNKAKQHKYINT